MRSILILAAASFCATTALAQRGGHAAGGFSGGHAASPGNRTAFAAPSSSRSANAARNNAPRQGTRPAYGRNGSSGAHEQGNWTSAGFIPSHNGYSQRYNNGRHVGYGYGVVGFPVYAYPAGYINGSGLDFDDNDPNDPNNQQGNGNGYADNNAGPLAYGPPEDDPYVYAPPYDPTYGPLDTARPPYNPAGVDGNRYAVRSDGMSHPMVTLIFKDGRQPLQIQNYAMTQTRVFVRDNGRERDIATSDLDIPATLAANRQAGVDFTLPGGQ
jgi:hypothetical protein